MSVANQTRPPLLVFYSYSHRDKEFREELELHLWGLKHQGLISGWHDRKISAGTEWASEINRHLESAHIILLLISANFIASEYCYDKEMKRAMERHEAGSARVIPIIIRAVDNWQAAPFGKLQAVPEDGKAVSQWEDRDAAWQDVARSIRLACQEMQESLKDQVVAPPLQEKSFKPPRDSITASGKVIELVNISDETRDSIDRIISVPTNGTEGQVGGLEGSRMPLDRPGTKRNIDEVLKMMDSVGGEQGETIDDVNIEKVSITRSDLLLKKAILLQAEAEEALFDSDLPEEEKNEMHRERLKEAFELLRKANEIDPTNTEVMLHMSQLLMVLTPDDPSDEQKLLKRIRKLLDEPKNETEEFRLARATYLLAVTCRPAKTNLLRDARDIFERLGQTKWVEQCDELLKISGELQRPDKPQISNMGFGEMWDTTRRGWEGLRGIFSKTKTATPAPAPAQNLNQPAVEPAQEAPAPQPKAPVEVTTAPTPLVQPSSVDVPPQPPASTPAVAPPAQFMPFGQWQLKVNDPIGSIVYVNFVPNGFCSGTQFSPGVGHIQFNGRWGYNTQDRVLRLQGLINGVQPFMLNIFVHGARREGFYGVGSDNYAYLLSPYTPQ